jgi:hypothetical protein
VQFRIAHRCTDRTGYLIGVGEPTPFVIVVTFLVVVRL